MNRPTPLSYLIGNPVGCVAALCFAGDRVLLWGTDQSGGNLLMAFVAVAGCSVSIKARKAIKDYAAWKREWEGMSGAAPERPKRLAKFWRILACVSIWCTSLGVITQYPDARGTPLYEGFELVFLGLTLAGVGLLLWRSLRAVRAVARFSKPKTEREHVVSVCLPVPRSLLREHVGAASLPAYCQPLLNPRSNS